LAKKKKKGQEGARQSVSPVDAKRGGGEVKKKRQGRAGEGCQEFWKTMVEKEGPWGECPNQSTLFRFCERGRRKKETGRKHPRVEGKRSPEMERKFGEGGKETRGARTCLSRSAHERGGERKRRREGEGGKERLIFFHRRGIREREKKERTACYFMLSYRVQLN